ncbi:transpeptidase family protein [Brucepastera parasyntrophica]|uniref:penicillin-binding protein n=1 Tax=Brucepastera parasyntrophica TaxID=2880008 RepID=UPI00210E3F29|nr:penicillin-binding protein [Brucepastera parasyntrophica]ULQ59413.1 transpeptidase family protein [Brucepastera parasyntrophica]
MEISPYISKKRLLILLVIALAIIAMLLFYYGRAMLGTQPDEAQPKIIIERGSILDRNGKILAVQTTFYNIAVTRSAITDKPFFAQVLSPLTDIPEEEILARLNSPAGDFFYLKKKISESERTAIAEAIKQTKLRGIRLEPVLSRTYPENQLASHVVGFLGDDGKGLTGIEYSFQDTLSPPVTGTAPVQSGYNVMLSIDGNIQYELEKLARQTMEDTQAEAVMMIVAEAKTGEILAYISEPSANLTTFTQSTASERVDRPALYAFEPGSVFKIFSIASFLDMGIVKETDRFYCDGTYTLTTPRGETVHINCLDKHGWMTPQDVMRFSCNDGTAQMAEKAENALFEAKLRACGFGSKTGIELPGETAGIFKANRGWSLRSKPTIAMGQEISVSALQMVEAATAVANKGVRIKLTLLSKLYTKDGIPVFQHRPEPVTRVFKEETAETMLRFMHTTAQTGSGARASVGDVPIAVKTGTAQMANLEKGGYSDTDFLSSCMGIFPANDPQIILYLAIVKPVGENYGGRIAAPVISKAANIVIDYLGIGRTQATSVQHSGIIPVPVNQPIDIKDIMPDLSGVSKKMLTKLIERQDLIIKISGDGYVTRQNPPPGTAIEKGMTIELHFE